MWIKYLLLSMLAIFSECLHIFVLLFTVKHLIIIDGKLKTTKLNVVTVTWKLYLAHNV